MWRADVAKAIRSGNGSRGGPCKAAWDGRRRRVGRPWGSDVSMTPGGGRATSGEGRAQLSGRELRAAQWLAGAVVLRGDEAALLAVLVATRRLLWVVDVAESVEVLTALVHELGGTTVPARLAGGEGVPLDLSFGCGEPLLPAAEVGSLARRRIECVLPTVMEDARRAIMLSRLVDQLAEETLSDPLTGLLNRRGAERLLSRLTAGDAVAMLDLDYFKRVNDTYGHGEGDRVLAAFALVLQTQSRLVDQLARLGGEEFLVVMRTTSPANACALIDRMRAAWTLARPYPVTFSAGVAAVIGADAGDALRAADAALYQAKDSGRNRTVTASPATGPASGAADHSSGTRIG